MWKVRATKHKPTRRHHRYSDRRRELNNKQNLYYYENKYDYVDEKNELTELEIQLPEYLNIDEIVGFTSMPGYGDCYYVDTSNGTSFILSANECSFIEDDFYSSIKSHVINTMLEDFGIYLMDDGHLYTHVESE